MLVSVSAVFIPAMRIVFVIYSLAAGGAERVASTMINHWVDAGEQVTLVTFDSVEKDFYRIDARVKRIALGLTGESKSRREFIGNNLRRVKSLRAFFRSSEFDVVVSFIDKANVLVLMATLGLGVPVIVSERNDPRKHAIGSVTAGLRRLLYPSRPSGGGADARRWPVGSANCQERGDICHPESDQQTVSRGP